MGAIERSCLMDPVQPWVDAEEMRRLAEALMASPTVIPKTIAEVGYSQEFEGYAGDAPTVTVGHKLLDPVVAAIVEPAVRSDPTQPMRADPLTFVKAPYAPRLRQYVEWVCSREPVLGMFLLNHDGKIVYDSGDHARYHFMARSLAQAAQRQQLAHAQMKIGAGDLLEVIPVDVEVGQWVVGLIMNRSLTDGDVVILCQSLQQVFVRTV